MATYSFLRWREFLADYLFRFNCSSLDMGVFQCQSCEYATQLYYCFTYSPGFMSSAILSRQKIFFFYLERVDFFLQLFAPPQMAYSSISSYFYSSFSSFTIGYSSSLQRCSKKSGLSYMELKFLRKAQSSDYKLLRALREFILFIYDLIKQNYKCLHYTYFQLQSQQSTIDPMRKIKAGKRGEVIKYVSRAKAIKKLQLSLKDFRRLCILKGVYPREPPKKLKKTSRTYYHLKDINFLALDPVIEKLRSQKVYLKKFKKAKAKGDVGKIQYLAKHKPKISLNHLVRERYPQFVDALRDLDDPLSLMALFTIFPTHKEFNLSGDKIELCSKLLRHFQLYTIRTNSLKRVFVSIKGIYYQSQIMGQKITYIVPFKYPANLPIDVDYRVMSTFLDFYIVLMKFVNYKLYTEAKLEYPPIEQDPTTYQGYEFKNLSTDENDDDRYKIDEQFKNKEGDDKNLLFAKLKFYLSTEVPRYSLEYVILAFGGQVSLDSNDSTITHVITDRQTIQREKTKEYVQPQWAYDSVNFNRLLNVKEYQVGKPLPPHISPFVNENDTERHIPERQKELRGIAIEKSEAKIEQEAENEYDIIAEKKKKLANKKQEEKEFSQISKNIMSNKNRKLLKVIQKSRGDKQQVEQKLKSKSKKLKEQ